MINIKSDSRKVKPGDIFIALRGISSDGHNYIESAIANGAIKIIAEEGSYSVETLIVKDTKDYLEKYLVENYGYLLDKIKLIGITGTNGKTSTSFYLYQSLNALGTKCGYVGNLGFYLDQLVRYMPNNTNDLINNYQLIYEAISQKFTHLVMEVSSQGLDGGRVNGLKYDYVVFTNLTHDHLDHHGTMKNYALAKKELFFKTKENGVALVNIDSEYSGYFLSNKLKTITYGYNPSEYQIIKTNIKKDGIGFTYNYQNILYDLEMQLIGKYNIYNVLVTAIILKQEGYDHSSIEKVISNLKSPSGRTEIINYKNNQIVIDYAHDPTSVANIIDTMKEITSGSIYTVFGCTGDRDKLKRPIMFDIATSKSNYVIITNDDPHFEDPNSIVSDMTKDTNKTNYGVILDRGQAIRKGISLLKENDTLLILGKGHEREIIIKNRRIPFNDWEEVQKIIK